MSQEDDSVKLQGKFTLIFSSVEGPVQSHPKKLDFCLHQRRFACWSWTPTPQSPLGALPPIFPLLALAPRSPWMCSPKFSLKYSLACHIVQILLLRVRIDYTSCYITPMNLFNCQAVIFLFLENS